MNPYVSLSSPGLYQSARVGGRNDRYVGAAAESWRIEISDLAPNSRSGADWFWKTSGWRSKSVSMKKSDNLRCRYLWRLGRITQIARHVLCLED